MYKLQNRYQDSGWEDINEEFFTQSAALERARELSKDSICYGMIRVIDTQNNFIIGYNNKPFNSKKETKYYCPFDGKQLKRKELFIDIGVVKLYGCDCGAKLKIIGSMYLISRN